MIFVRLFETFLNSETNKKSSHQADSYSENIGFSTIESESIIRLPSLKI